MVKKEKHARIALALLRKRHVLQGLMAYKINRLHKKVLTDKAISHWRRRTLERVLVSIRLEAVKSTNEHLMERKAFCFYELQLSKRALLALAVNVQEGR